MCEQKFAISSLTNNDYIWSNLVFPCILQNRSGCCFCSLRKQPLISSPREYRLHKYVWCSVCMCVCVCVCVCVCRAAWILVDIQCVGGLNDPPWPVLSTAPVGNQALFQQKSVYAAHGWLLPLCICLTRAGKQSGAEFLSTQNPGFQRRVSAIFFNFKLYVSLVPSEFYPNLNYLSSPLLSSPLYNKCWCATDRMALPGDGRRSRIVGRSGGSGPEGMDTEQNWRYKKHGEATKEDGGTRKMANCREEGKRDR